MSSRGRERAGWKCVHRLLPMVAMILGWGLARAGEAAAPERPEIELRDWMAVGSGCQARLSQPGDARVQVRKDARVAGRYELQVELPSYRLEGDRPAAPGAVDFARECAIRLAVYPAQGKRLKALRGSATFSVDRDAGARIRLRSRLLLGDETLSRMETWVSPTGGSTQDLSIRPDAEAAGGTRRASSCAEPRIVGLDLSAAIFRRSSRPTASVALARRVAFVTLEVEDCARPAPPDVLTH